MLATVFQGENYPYKDFRIASNAITINVQDIPESLRPALELWQGKEQATIIMQDAFYEVKDYSEGLRKLKELIRRYPSSPYAVIAKQHLTKIGDPEFNQLFPDDRRLDQQITYEFPQVTPLEEVLTRFSKQTRVPLSLAPDLKRQSLRSLRLTETLRNAMKGLIGSKSKWIREGDGYKLVPKDDSVP